MSNAASHHVLVVAPHPDDESFGCGGMIRLITAAGGQVDVVYMTRGELGSENPGQATLGDQERLAAQRSSEGVQACRVLGVSGVHFLPGRDGHLHAQPELAAELHGMLLAGQYRSVFCPWPHDSHCDHAATFDMLVTALRQYPREIEVWLYEVWTPLPPNMVIPIDAAIDAKVEAMQAHESQQAVLDYVAAFRALARYRSLFYPSSTYAEAFYTCDGRRLCEGRGFPWSQQGAPSPEASSP